MILVDTSAFIEFLNCTGSPYDRAIQEMTDDGGGEICITGMVLTEILQGIRDERAFREVRDSLLAFRILSLTSPDSYIKAAQIYRNCRKKGFTIRRAADCLIAQVAIENNLELLHNDRDFEAIANVVRLRRFSVT